MPDFEIDAPTVAQVQERIDAVQADETLDQAAKDALLTPLRAALQSLQARDAALTERQQFLDAAQAAPGTIEQLRSDLDQPVVIPQFEDFSQRPPDQALDAIRALLTEAQARQDAAKAELLRLQSESAAREVKLAEAPTQLVRWREDLSEAITAMAAVPEDPADPAAQARRWQQQAAAAELAARIARLEAEVASYQARQELLPLRVSLAQRKADTAGRVIEILTEAQTEAANRKALQTQRQAEQQAREVRVPELSRLAEQTSELAAKRLGPTGTLAALEAVRRAQARRAAELIDLQRRARNTQARVRAAGLTEIVGRSLRAELVRLPEIDPADSDRLSEAMGQAQFELIDVQEQLSSYEDVQAAIARLRRQIGRNDEPLSPELDRQITDIVTAYVETLRALESDYQNFNDEALRLEATRKTLIDTTEAFRTFIEERILWTRSVQGLLVPSIEDLSRGTVWLLGGRMPAQGAPPEAEALPIGSQWLAALGDLWPPRFVAFPVLLALLASIWARGRAAKGLKNTAAQVRKFASDRMSLTLAALSYTVLMALPLPIALLLVGLLLEGTQPLVASAVGAAFLDVIGLAFSLEFIRHASRNDGLVEAHFRWRREGLVHLRRLVFLFEITLLPLAIIALAFLEQPEALLSDGVGRMAFVASQLVMATFFAWAFAPWLPFVRAYLSRHKGGFTNQTRWVWYPLLVAAPLALAALASVGFYYTAAQLDQRLQLTAWLLVGILLGYSMVLRWLFIERRRLLVKRAQQKREAEKQEQQSGPGGGELEGIELDNRAELDAAEVDTQTRRVLTAAVIVGVVLGLYGLWTEQLPALRMLDRIQLYPYPDFTPTEDEGIAPGLIATSPASGPQAVQEGTAQEGAAQAETARQPAPSPFGPPAGGGSAESTPSEPFRAITLADVGAMLIFFALAWILARNLPGLLEITILKRLPLDSGARFAVTSILRYVIGIIGILLAFSAIGIGWSQVQFLAAALTFGLAFGLQEIFANFISGLIILVERPMRVGDTVTVNGMDGKVTRIRMRATTILDWELREVIVPNKVFITQEFTNWTLSDPRIRVTIPVGVAYGSDVRLVERTLLEIGQSHPHVVSEPRVRSLFLGFGDSTLNFELRVYLENYDFFLEARSGLHTRIAERFRELDIEIAFPQRDLNIRDIGPLADALSGRIDHRAGPARDEQAAKETR